MSDDTDKVKFLTEKERRSHPRKAECRAAISAHLATVGSRDWADIQQQFSEIPLPTFWRWVRELKKEAPDAPELGHARKRLRNVEDATIARHEEAKAAGVAHIAKDLPAAPSPAYVSRAGERAMANLDFAIQIQRLYADAEMLRAYSVTKDETAEGGERIKNPLTFDRSIARRASILEAGLHAMQELWDLRTMQAFYETVIEEIGKESPDVQKRILSRLADLNSRTGMTLSMRL